MAKVTAGAEPAAAGHPGADDQRDRGRYHRAHVPRRSTARRCRSSRSTTTCCASRSPRSRAWPGSSQAQIVPTGTGADGNSLRDARLARPRPARGAASHPVRRGARAAGEQLHQHGRPGAVRQRHAHHHRQTSLDDSAAVPQAWWSRAPAARWSGSATSRRSSSARENYTQAVYYNGMPAVFIGVYPTPGANDAGRGRGRAHAPSRELSSALPPGIGVVVTATTRPNTSSNSIDEVMLTIGITLVVVVVVIFLFLGSLRSLLIPAMAIPLSIVGGGNVHDRLRASASTC